MLQNKPTLFGIIRNYYLPLEYICTLLIGSFFTFGFLGLGGPSALAALDFIGSYKKSMRYCEMIPLEMIHVHTVWMAKQALLWVLLATKQRKNKKGFHLGNRHNSILLQSIAPKLTDLQLIQIFFVNKTNKFSM